MQGLSGVVWCLGVRRLVALRLESGMTAVVILEWRKAEIIDESFLAAKKMEGEM